MFVFNVAAEVGPSCFMSHCELRRLANWCGAGGPVSVIAKSPTLNLLVGLGMGLGAGGIFCCNLTSFSFDAARTASATTAGDALDSCIFTARRMASTSISVEPLPRRCISRRCVFQAWSTSFSSDAWRLDQLMNAAAAPQKQQRIPASTTTKTTTEEEPPSPSAGCGSAATEADTAVT